MLSDLLGKTGPCLSSKLAAELCQAEQIKPATARKRIERAKALNEIFAVPGIKFRHNEQFLYTKAQEYTPELQKALFKALMDSNSAYRLPLLGIQSRGGMVPEFLFPTISGFPLTARDGRQNCFAALSHLTKAKLLVHSELYDKICVSSVFAPNIVSDARHHSRMIAESILLLAIRDWARLQGLLSLEKISVRGEERTPQFGFFQWDLVGPSYMAPMAQLSKDKLMPGFIVVDVTLGRKLTLADITPFLHKVTSVRANLNHRPFLAMLFSDWFEKEALLEGRRHGLLLTTPKNFFGKHFAELLDDFIQACEDKKSFLQAEPYYLRQIVVNLKIIEHLSEATIKAGNELYKLLLGFCYSKLSNADPSYDILIDQTHVADLYIRTNIATTICQTIWSASKGPLTPADISDWLLSLPLLLSAVKARATSPAQLILCTNRTFSNEALLKLNQAAVEFPISWIDGPTLRNMIEPIDPFLNSSIPERVLDKLTTDS